MSISKIKMLQGRICKKFEVYTSFQCQQGFEKKKFYTNISVYDEIHSHRNYKNFNDAVKDLEHYLAMTDKSFKYESAKDKAIYKLKQKKLECENICDDIAELELIVKKIELKENLITNNQSGGE